MKSQPKRSPDGLQPPVMLTLNITAMYSMNFKPQILTDITIPAKQSYSPNTGKKSQGGDPIKNHSCGQRTFIKVWAPVCFALDMNRHNTI